MIELTLLITSGSGPRECQYAARGIARAYAKEASDKGLTSIVLEQDTPGSYLLCLAGNDIDSFLKARIGTVKWICQSPFRKNHKRKNWFIGVYRLPELHEIAELEPKDVTFTAMRASGPGGQHVNKTNSAVRAVHSPTGLTVTAQEERSQHANKKLCLVKLTALFAQAKDNEQAKNDKSIWLNHKQLERGNPIRIYRSEKFKL